jgi:hypothetical protein
MNEIKELKQFIDREGRLTQWPAKRSLQLVALDYLSSKFEGKMYTESEVNNLLNQWHTFGDPALLRREMYEIGHLNRLKDGAEYWPTPHTRHW